ncbi:hypothetical protein RJ639_012302 [Escallonia herrerae]|uniref:14-3-3 domain-containing protein n=1 Tax=Escallonia herrerae TaxID=1293975 RepID=A0AA88VMY5_9ASTE|nr:hypothetical protein RJ639_012302 [Escallonia herrerae]
MDNQKRCNNVFMAKLASEAERFDDMAKFMAELVVGLASEEELTKEERLLFSRAYEKVVALKREALLAVMDNGNGDLVKEYRSKLKAELLETCATASRLVGTVIPRATSPESKVHCVMMRADFRRYMAEFLHGKERDEEVAKAAADYEAARGIATAELAADHYLTLGLMLNLAVFKHDCLGSTCEAIKIAKEALMESDFYTSETPRDPDVTAISSLLYQNHLLWSSLI